jgi:CRP/FNR family transcriptional regulator, nitrogen oxide reductase regulator
MAFARPDAEHVSTTAPLFRGLDQAAVRAILAKGKRRIYQRGQIILQASDSATHVYLLISGRARHYRTTPKGRRLLIRWLNPGTAFGIQTLSQEHGSYGVDTEMVQPGEALAWDRETMHGLAQRYPALFANALTIAMSYIERYHTIHMGLTSSSAEQRLAQALLDFSETLGRDSPKGREMSVKNKHVADMANINFFTASRILSAWHRQGLIIKSRGRIVLRSPERLARLL